jgi:hypothetical protein
MTKIIKNQYLGVAKVDSLKIRIPLTSLIKYDESLEYHYLKVCEETGEIEKEFKDESKSYDIEGVPLKVGIAKRVRTGKTFEDYLYILINSKQVGQWYFKGLDLDTVCIIWQRLIDLNIIEIEWMDFLYYSIPTDIDIKIDYELPMDEYKEMLNGCFKMTKPSNNRDVGCTTFKKKGNVGISWSVRETSKYITSPYLKIYHKGLEMQYKSYEFYERHLSNYDLKDCFRIETTIKNRKHLRELNKSLKLGLKEYNLIELLRLMQEKNKHLAKSIVQKAVNSHLLPRKKSFEMFKDKKKMTPADSIMFSSLLGFIEDCGWTYLQVEKLLLSRIENESSKSLNKKKLFGFYQDIIKDNNYEIKTKKVESIFDSWGWF